jgi:hypothetical protein
LFPHGELVVLVVLTRFVVRWTVLVVPTDAVVELAMNVEVMFQSLRYLFCRVSTVAVTVLHRCLLVRDIFS